MLSDADFTGANLKNADLTGANLENADFRNAAMDGVKWGGIASVKGANVLGVKNAGFVEWAMGKGAVRREEE